MLGRTFIVLMLALGAVGSSAQDESAEPQASEPRDAPRDPERAPAPDPSEDVFIPSEEVAADEEVTFPVDI